MSTLLALNRLLALRRDQREHAVARRREHKVAASRGAHRRGEWQRALRLRARLGGAPWPDVDCMEWRDAERGVSTRGGEWMERERAKRGTKRSSELWASDHADASSLDV